MKQEGVVIDYNGYDGMIETVKKEQFILLREEIVDDEALNKLDKVMFVPEYKQYESSEYNIARFVRKLHKSNQSNNRDLNI